LNTSIDLDTKEIFSWMEWLAGFGLTKNGGVTRLLYDANWKNAQHALFERMKELELEPYFDGVGNLFGRLKGTVENDKVILTGSHIDTVIDGGKYDGAYGVVASLLAVNYLHKHYGKPKRTIEIVSLCEEEGSRFPLAFWGSGSITGKYKEEDCKELYDTNNINFKKAMNDTGMINSSKKTKRDDIASFVEVHIEQGAILESEKKSIGIVSHIVGQRRFNIRVKGESNHAGTTPMTFRRDSVHLASELISYALNKVPAIDSSLVATVGKMTVSPNIPNVIANEVIFTLDVRHHQESVLNQYCDIIFSFFREKCLQTGMELEIEKWVDVKPVEMNGNLTEICRSVVTDMKVPYKEMVSGAGHDAQIFGTYCPTALLFVPSVNGISHSPKEWTKMEDLRNGIVVLFELLHRMAY